MSSITRTSLTADGDCDDDLEKVFSNLQEWWYALGGDTTGLSKDLPEVSEIEEAAEYFAAIVRDPEIPPGDWEPHEVVPGGVPCGRLE